VEGLLSAIYKIKEKGVMVYNASSLLSPANLEKQLRRKWANAMYEDWEAALGAGAGGGGEGEKAAAGARVENRWDASALKEGSSAEIQKAYKKIAARKEEQARAEIWGALIEDLENEGTLEAYLTWGKGYDADDEIQKLTQSQKRQIMMVRLLQMHEKDAQTFTSETFKKPRAAGDTHTPWAAESWPVPTAGELMQERFGDNEEWRVEAWGIGDEVPVRILNVNGIVQPNMSANEAAGIICDVLTRETGQHVKLDPWTPPYKPKYEGILYPTMTNGWTVTVLMSKATAQEMCFEGKAKWVETGGGGGGGDRSRGGGGRGGGGLSCRGPSCWSGPRSASRV